MLDLPVTCKKVLITGGMGSIGKLITPFLLGTGHEVTLYDRLLNQDIFDAKALADSMAGQDALIHLVAIPHPGVKGRSDKDYWKMNLESLEFAFKLAAEAGIKRIIFPSTGCVYGFWGGHGTPDQFPILESNRKPSREEGLTVYGETKLACEDFLRENCEKHGIRSVALRIESIGYTPTVADMRDPYDGYGTLTEATCSAFHMLASTSLENFHQVIYRALHRDLAFHAREFNIVNDYVHWSIDVQRFIADNYPGVPNHTTGNESLCSNQAAREHLGYTPYPVANCYPDRDRIVRQTGEYTLGGKDKILRRIKQGVKTALTLKNKLLG